MEIYQDVNYRQKQFLKKIEIKKVKQAKIFPDYGLFGIMKARNLKI